MDSKTACKAVEAPILCVNNCGFFGSVTTRNMCSKCHREALLSKSATAVVEVSCDSMPGPEMKEGPLRCTTCRKRVGLTGFRCRCGKLLCSSHRHSDKHDCLFDFRAAGRVAIAHANPVIRASKLIDRI